MITADKFLMSPWIHPPTTLGRNCFPSFVPIKSVRERDIVRLKYIFLKKQLFETR